jgi:hypothetical protein
MPIHRTAPAALAVLGLLVGGGCGGTNGGGDAGAQVDASVRPDAASGDPSQLAGTFQVRLVPPEDDAGVGYTSVVGKVFDGPTPALLVWSQAATDGPCALWKPTVPFCSQACGGNAVCVADEKCRAYPTARSVGTVTVTGMRTTAGATTFAMDPIASSYQPDQTLPYPAFDEGDDIVFAASGGDFAAFSLKSKGIEALELTTGTVTLAENQPLALTWTAPGMTGISTIHVKLDISHHGGIKGMIECDADDTGSLQISASLVTALLHLGVAGFPSIAVTRQSIGSATIAAGRVELDVSSDVEKLVQIPGLVSCNKDTDCPDGGTCQTNLSCL